MSFYYAQITADGIAIGVSQLSERVNNPEMVLLAAYDVGVLGKKWTGSGWVEVPPPEPTEPEPTQEELNNLALMEGIAGLYETQIALETRMTTDNLTVMEGIAGLFEAQMGGI